jgi:hypothetical protein
LKVNSTVYDFPDGGDTKGEGRSNYWGVILGKPSSVWTNPTDPDVGVFVQKYPDNFDGMTISDSTASLKTVLTVDPAILGTGDDYDNGFAKDPYKYIKVKGIVSE